MVTRYPWCYLCLIVVGVKLTRYGIQETRDGQVNLFVRAPVQGFYYLTVYSTQVLVIVCYNPVKCVGL